MKTTKKIFAAFLAVMMIALMIPFTASAADETYTASIKGLKDYTISIYKVATLTKSTGAYSGYNSKLSDALTTPSTKGVNTQDLLDACNSLTDAELGTAVASTKFTDNETSYVFSTPNAGVYYIKWTAYKTGASVKQVTNSVLSLPYYKNGAWNNSYDAVITTKINDGTPTVSKEFVGRNNDVFTDDEENGKASVTEFTGEKNTIKFKLKGSVTGTNAVPSISYKIIDTYTNGLTVNFDNNFKVTLTGGANDITLTKDDYTVTQETGKFTVELKSNVLNKDTDLDSVEDDTQNFYSFANVEVTYNGYLNDNAVNAENKPTVNDVELKYSQKENQENTVEGDEVHLYSFSLDVVKVDANTPATKLNDAGFTLYTDKECKTVATNGTEQLTRGTEVVDDKEVAKGIATFTGLKAGKYFLKETSAPTGYNINSTVYEINISNKGVVTTSNGTTVTQIEVPDTPLLTPKTGGMGTMMFTIGGAALIACAGVLFLIVRKKKSAK